MNASDMFKDLPDGSEFLDGRVLDRLEPLVGEIVGVTFVLQKRHPNCSKEWDGFRRWHDHPEFSVGEKHSTIERCEKFNRENEGVEYRVIERVETSVHYPNRGMDGKSPSMIEKD